MVSFDMVAPSALPRAHAKLVWSVQTQVFLQASLQSCARYRCMRSIDSVAIIRGNSSSVERCRLQYAARDPSQPCTALGGRLSGGSLCWDRTPSMRCAPCRAPAAAEGRQGAATVQGAAAGGVRRLLHRRLRDHRPHCCLDHVSPLTGPLPRFVGFQCVMCYFGGAWTLHCSHGATAPQLIGSQICLHSMIFDALLS